MVYTDTLGSFTHGYPGEGGVAQYAGLVAPIDTSWTEQQARDTLIKYLPSSILTAAHDDTVLMVGSSGETYVDTLSSGIYTTHVTSAQWGSPYYPCLDDVCPVTQIVTLKDGDTLSTMKKWWDFDGSVYSLEKSESWNYHNNRRASRLTRTVLASGFATADSSFSGQLRHVVASSAVVGGEALSAMLLPESAYAEGGCFQHLANYAADTAAAGAHAYLAQKFNSVELWQQACSLQNCADAEMEAFLNCRKGKTPQITDGT